MARELAATTDGAGRDPRAAAAVAVLVALSIWLVWQSAASSGAGIDFYQFWLVGRAQASAQVSNPYSAEGRAQLLAAGRALSARSPGAQRLAAAVAYRTRIETFSTPFLYAAVAAVASDDFEASLDRFHALSLACAVLGVALLCRLAGSSWTLTGLWLLAVVWFGEPLRSDLRVANVNSLQLGAIATYVWLRRHGASRRSDAAAGAVLSGLVLFKPTLGIAGVFLAIGWVARREWSVLATQAAAFAATSALAVAASCLFFRSPRVWLDWLAALPDLERAADVSLQNGNYALARLASEQGMPDLSAVLVAVLVAGMAAAAWLGARRESSGPARARSDSLAFALGCAASVVALRLAWLHYYLLVTPLAIDLFSRPRAPAWWLTLVGFATILVLGGPAEVVAPTLGNEATAACYVTGAILLLTAGGSEIARVRRGEAS
ncbi:MAG: glycosyltransferase 87 family protein [Myxococcota bacterium]